MREGNGIGSLSLLSRWLSWLAADPRHRSGLRILQVSIGVMFLFKIITEWRLAVYLWGPSGLGAGKSVASVPPIIPSHLGRWLENVFFSSDLGTYSVLCLIGVASAGLLTGRLTFWSTGLALVMSSLLNNRLPLLPDGGDNVTQLVLTYMLLTLPPRAFFIRGSLRVWLHNLAILAIAIQIVIVYFVAGLSKAHGDMWQHGVALYYISQVSIFSDPLAQKLFSHASIVTIATYSILFWELTFPVAVASRFRILWILIGIVFEVGVLQFMGLVTFSTVMIGLLLFLITDEEYVRLTKLLRSAKMVVRSRLVKPAKEAILGAKEGRSKGVTS